MELKPRICKICGKEFTPSDVKQKYCSVNCRYIAKRKRARSLSHTHVGVEKSCKFCGRVFHTSSHNQVFCTEACRRAYTLKDIQKYEERIARANAEPQGWRDSCSLPRFQRRCHDCGRPTNNYRCNYCLEIWRRKHGVDLSGDVYDMDED